MATAVRGMPRHAWHSGARWLSAGRVYAILAHFQKKCNLVSHFGVSASHYETSSIPSACIVSDQLNSQHETWVQHSGLLVIVSNTCVHLAAVRTRSTCILISRGLSLALQESSAITSKRTGDPKSNSEECSSWAHRRARRRWCKTTRCSGRWSSSLAKVSHSFPLIRCPLFLSANCSRSFDGICMCDLGGCAGCLYALDLCVSILGRGISLCAGETLWRLEALIGGIDCFAEFACGLHCACSMPSHFHSRTF